MVCKHGQAGLRRRQAQLTSNVSDKLQKLPNSHFPTPLQSMDVVFGRSPAVLCLSVRSTPLNYSRNGQPRVRPLSKLRWGHCTVRRLGGTRLGQKAVPKFGEFCYCCCLPLLPGFDSVFKRKSGLTTKPPILTWLWQSYRPNLRLDTALPAAFTQPGARLFSEPCRQC